MFESLDSAAPVMVWHDIASLPSESLNIFRDPALYAILCSYCKSSANLACDESVLSRIFCESCRIKLGQAPKFRCRGRCDECVVTRFIDPMGRVAPLCRGCHRRGATSSRRKQHV